MLLETPVMFSQPSPVRPAATGSDTAAKTIGVSVPSKTVRAACAVEVAIGIRMSTPSAWMLESSVTSAVESPLALPVTISTSAPEASREETMVSRI